METKIVNKYKEPYDVYIGRGSLFGNPFSHINDRKTAAEFIVSSREEAIEEYRKYFYDKIEKDFNFKEQVMLLKGKTLGCFCKPKSCHGDIICEFLNNMANIV